MIEYHNPEASTGVEQHAYELSTTIRDSGQVSIGLLANGFPDSVNFLTALGQELNKLVPDIDIQAYNKGNATIPAGEALLSKVSGECSAVVAAYGH